VKQQVAVFSFYLFFLPFLMDSKISPQVKKFLSSITALSILFLAGCTAAAPMTEEEQAAEYGLTVEQFRTEKNAAARMNMNFEEHIKMMKKN
jgi:hypothetical protein